MLDCLNRQGVAKTGNFGGKLPRLQKLTQVGVLTGSATIQTCNRQRHRSHATPMIQRYCNTRVGDDPDDDRLLAALPSQPDTISPLLPLKKLAVLAHTNPHKSVGLTGKGPTLPFSRTKWRIPSFHGGFPTISPLSPIYASTAPPTVIVYPTFQSQYREITLKMSISC